MAECSKKLTELRAVMAKHNVGAWIIMRSDPHCSEYIADRWTGVNWISGFTGSFGSVVVLPKKAALWTDGRYHIQAEEELKGTGLELMRLGNPDVPTISDWLSVNLKARGEIVGFDGDTVSIEFVRSLMDKLKHLSPQFFTKQDLLQDVWLDRSEIPNNPIFAHDEILSGKSLEEKILDTRTEMLNLGVEYILLTTLDDIAWLLNLRGSDIACTPVFLAYVIISPKVFKLFVNKKSIPEKIIANLKKMEVTIFNYSDIHKELEKLESDSRILVDPKNTSYNLYNAIINSDNILEKQSPTRRMKAVKNRVELISMEQCHKRDGAAIVKFMHWLDMIILKKKITEWDVVERLEGFRAEEKSYKGPSFPTIAGYGANGAVIHYNPGPKTGKVIEPRGLLLVDSGAQYPDGTTDITRTLVCGELTEEEKIDYTTVMKGHIALARAHFKKDTQGMQLDALARQPLWRMGLDYSHGTGHGVGFFLGVHESPPSIGSRVNKMAFESGMIVTNEPGIYRRGKHGVRLENIMLVEQALRTSFGEFYKFKTLTIAPFDTRPLLKNMLSNDEVNWIDSYHSLVLDTLSDVLSEEVRDWLVVATKPIAGSIDN